MTMHDLIRRSKYFAPCAMCGEVSEYVVCRRCEKEFLWVGSL